MTSLMPTKKQQHHPNPDAVAKDVTKAVAGIVLDDPFYGYLLLRLKIVSTYSVDTAAVDGVTLFYNPNFVSTLSLSQLKGLLKHEVMHVAYKHHLRRQDRQHKKWNCAADYVINALLVDSGEELPENGLIDTQYKDYSTEAVYARLPDDPNGPDGPDGPGWGEVQDHPDLTNANVDQLEADVNLEVVQAANTAKIMGKMPAGLESFVESVKESKMPWRKILNRFFSAADKAQESWLYPNRRWLSHGFIFPSRRSLTMGPVVIGLDTSGSMSNDEINLAFSCINAILKRVKPTAIHIICCDAAVHSEQVLTVKDLPLTAEKLVVKGRGGTAFKPVFDYIEEKKIKPKVVLYMTDMYASFDFTPPKYPVFWCATTTCVAPWGKTLEIK